MWQTDDRQTDHAMEKCVGIGVIGCAARAISPKNIRKRLTKIYMFITTMVYCR